MKLKNGQQTDRQKNYIRFYIHCGNVHAVRLCPVFGDHCKSCNKNNHFTETCRSPPVQGSKEVYIYIFN